MHQLEAEEKDGSGAVWALSRRRFGVRGVTCGSCVQRVERSLLSVTGVSGARVGLSGKQVEVTFDGRLVSFTALQKAVTAAGYGLNELPATPAAREDTPLSFWNRMPKRAVAAGMGAALALASLYILIVGVAQDFDHSLSLVTGEWYFVIPIVLGFGVQVGLFVYARAMLQTPSGTKSTKLLGGAGTGTSTVAMVACCAHHLADVLPVIGLSAAALFVNEYRGPLMALGIISNAAGIVWMVRLVRNSRGRGSPSGAHLSRAAY